MTPADFRVPEKEQPKYLPTGCPISIPDPATRILKAIADVEKGA